MGSSVGVRRGFEQSLTQIGLKAEACILCSGDWNQRKTLEREVACRRQDSKRATLSGIVRSDATQRRRELRHHYSRLPIPYSLLRSVSDLNTTAKQKKAQTFSKICLYLLKT